MGTQETNSLDSVLMLAQETRGVTIKMLRLLNLIDKTPMLTMMEIITELDLTWDMGVKLRAQATKFGFITGYPQEHRAMPFLYDVSENGKRFVLKSLRR